ncbi:DUF1673 family protein [Methanoregula formicica]|uniref:DUF1673 family protein n=1 Tax=Methanoregula formicica (strain DSM 22288 / NBRC 105244 / SMSP) TaxID=593750 RepID=L0HCW7_METFS|nr:DUF1673 family protein [Methanoregula formicica]AGB01631.1 Protein of unknown function (DUF1673) [Methanoregula formicica SMSP]
MTRVSEVIRGWLGWCPNAQQRTFRRDSATDTTHILPAGSGGDVRTLSFGWKNRYRTRALAFALCMTVVGISLFAISEGDKLGLLIKGLIGASFLFALDGIRYWTLFEDVRTTGRVEVIHWSRRRPIQYLVLISSLLIIGFAILVFFGFVPGLGLRTLDAFLAGFTVIGWLHLIMIIAWERQSGLQLYTDGKQIYRRA